jgi:predicted RNase H-like nuclease (RuvC/YqgF family)
MSNADDTRRGALGVGERLNKHDARLSDQNKRIKQLERKVDALIDVCDLEAVGKKIRILQTDNLEFTGTIVAITKFKIKLQLNDGSTRIFNKGQILRYQEL